MPIDMKGYKVVHGNHAYKCLTAEPIWGDRYIDPGEIYRPEILRVCIIDHDGYFAIIEDHANQFAFLRDGEK